MNKPPFKKPRIRQQRLKLTGEELPPHNPDHEHTALGCVLLAGDHATQDEVKTLLRQLRLDFFYEVRHRNLFKAMVEMAMAEGNAEHWSEEHSLCFITLIAWLKHHNRIEECGGSEYVLHLTEIVPHYLCFRSSVPVLRHLFFRRQLARAEVRFKELIHNPEVTLDEIQEVYEDLAETTAKYIEKRPALKIWRANELIAYEPPAHLRLVGDNEINMGYDGLALLSGPGSSGKSLAAGSLALAGAIGSGTWMGRQVHRKFKTLILQAENGSVRLKDEIEAMSRAHPEVPINDHIFISEPPEGGLPFHVPEFRRAMRKHVNEIGAQLVILDTWAQCAAEDSSKDVMDKLTEIRSCFPTGENCPGLLILAHIKKPRNDEIRRGRALTFNILGSIALPNTARCVYMLLPWSDDLEDDRIYWACTKLNNGKMYAPSVWHRRFGTFFEHDAATDPTRWGIEETDDGEHQLQYEDLVEAFGSEHVLRKGDLAKRLVRNTGVGESTAYRAISSGKGGYLSKHVKLTNEGWVQLAVNGENGANGQ